MQTMAGAVADMKRKIITAVACVMLIAGLGFLLFPVVSNYIGGLISKSETEKFDAAVSNIIETSYEQALDEGLIDSEGYPVDDSGNRISDVKAIFRPELDRLYSDSVKYNESLADIQGTTASYDYSDSALDLTDYGIYDGIYCYISAPTIGMRLPVYLGASDYAMSYGAAHMANTSLPISGESTNAAIAGHTGYIGRIFFDNLRGLSAGDSVSVKNYFETIDYTVTETKIVSEYYARDMIIKEGRQTLTLVTCVPNNSGGFDRFLVICERV